MRAVFIGEGLKLALRRPIEPDEVRHLARLGSELKRLRLAAELTQWALADLAHLSVGQVGNLERGASRTRRSTLQRIVSGLVSAAPELGPADRLLEDLVQTAGVALAPESPYADRIERRRQRRKRKSDRQRVKTWQPPSEPEPRRAPRQELMKNREMSMWRPSKRNQRRPFLG